MIKEAKRNAHYLGDYASLLTDVIIISYHDMLTSLEDYNAIRFGVEVIKLFAVVGSLSKFIIYILMSAKLRRELKRQLLCCCNKKNKSHEDKIRVIKKLPNTEQSSKRKNS